MQTITPFLWYDGKAEEAARLYTSIFPNSKIKAASPMSAEFTLDGQDFIAFNGGPHYQFTPAVSLFVHCKDQAEVDYYWNKLGEGGREDRCGWLQDRFGLSWQIIPRILGELLRHEDPATAKRAMDAMLQMQKIDIAKLEAAARG